MNIQTLPQDLPILSESPVLLFDYHLSDPNINNKIVLTKNVISFLVEGTKQLITHGHTQTISNEEFLVIKSGNCLMSEDLSPSRRYESMLFFFSDELLLDFLEKHKVKPIHSETPNPYHVCKYDTYIKNFVGSLRYILSLERRVQEPLLLAKFEEIMVYLYHKKGLTFFQTSALPQDTHVRHFFRVIESNILNYLTIQELAFLCNMSVSTFKREFEKHYHESPIRWFQEKRLNHAGFLLKTSQKRPTDIYEEAGFESLSSFTQAFKQKFGITPKQYQSSSLNF